jgi:hypothetical protein
LTDIPSSLLLKKFTNSSLDAAIVTDSQEDKELGRGFDEFLISTDKLPIYMGRTGGTHFMKVDSLS